ncbi:MAG TPA: M28 family peptidase [Granulicella sp.]|jgi:aminopeptidase YwaD|nr:M28 family peptidase [Granulicella sp.]
MRRRFGNGDRADLLVRCGLAAGLTVLLTLGTAALGLAQQGWVVRPEWVQAHEDFLASDALAGRGSATRDEEIAAEYVASEFVAFGLKPAPAMTGMIQSAEVIAPELDGRATLAANGVTLEEGSELRLLSASGSGVSGPLLRLSAVVARSAAVPKGSVVLLMQVPVGTNALTLANGLRRSGAALVLFEEDEAERVYVAKNPKTRVGVRLRDEPVETRAAPATVAALSKEAFAWMAAVPVGAAVTLTVHALPAAQRRTFNAIGYLAGTDPASGTILLTAHLDHLGVASVPVNGDAIYNGANDDAAGTTAVLELAHAMAAGPRLRRSILFVCYGSEEVGGLGSEFFGRHSPIPLSQIVTNLEFEMIGAQDPKMPKGTLLLTGWERSNLGPVLREHGARLGPDPYPEQHFFERSDNYQLALDGVVAHTAAGWGTVPTYHQVNDDLAHLNLEFMTVAIQSLVEPIRWLAGSDFRPAWNPGGRPTR